MLSTWTVNRITERVFKALSSHDIKEFMNVWDKNGVLLFPGNNAESGVFEGHTAIEGWAWRFLERFPEIQFDLLNIFTKDVMGYNGSNMFAVHWMNTMVNLHGEKFSKLGVSLVTVKEGKILRMEDYILDIGDELKKAWY